MSTGAGDAGDQLTVATLMRLEPESVVETAAQHNNDSLIHVNGQVVGTVKFDVTRNLSESA